MNDYHFETPEPVRLYVELGSGSVDVTAEDVAESRVEVVGPDADRTLVELNGDQLSVIAPKDRLGGFLAGDRKLSITITVPMHSALAAKTGSADMDARGRYATCRIKSGSGDIRVEALADVAVIETGSGDVQVDSGRAGVRIKSGSGDIEVRRAGAETSVSTGSGDVRIDTSEGPVAVKTGSGDLWVGEAGGDVKFSTASGDLTVEAAQRGRVSSKSASGDVRLGVPAGLPVWTDLSTVTGRVSSDLSGAGQPEPGQAYVELRVKTVSGDVVLAER